MTTTGTSPDLEILFEDNHLLVINKPSGVLSQEDHTGKPDVLTLCKEYLKREHNKPGKAFLGLVHRLDKPVSGVMLMAKTSKAASRISEQIRKQTVKKRYLAVVEGKTPENGFLQDHLLKDEQQNITRIVKPGTSGSKESILIYNSLHSTDNYTLLAVSLITGRAHQIRVQLAGMGAPVYGDRKYGNRQESSIALHAHELTLQHPTLKKEITFTAVPKKEFPWSLFKHI